ncbi:MAG: hypothetical protein ACTHW7_15160 [Actinomycetaceae bacterium]
MSVTVTDRMAAVVEDVEWMLAGGEHPDRIVPRVGYRSLDSLTKRLEAVGRNDLAAAVRSRRWTA